MAAPQVYAPASTYISAQGQQKIDEIGTFLKLLSASAESFISGDKAQCFIHKTWQERCCVALHKFKHLLFSPHLLYTVFVSMIGYVA